MRAPPTLAVLTITLLAGCGSAAVKSQPGGGRTIAPRTSQQSRSHAQKPKLPPLPLIVNHGPRTRREIALTFDADMTEGMLAALRSGAQRTWYDRRIVAELRATHTPATIFLTGLWTKTYPSAVRDLAHDPLFELENHSVDHAGWEAPCYGLPVVSSTARKRWEVTAAARTIAATAGRAPRFFRFPGGCYNRADLRLIAAAGEHTIGWDVVSGDPFQPDPAVVIHNVLSGARPGSIVVMHLHGAPNAPATATALRAIIPELKRRGFRFVTLQALIADKQGDGANRPPHSPGHRG